MKYFFDKKSLHQKNKGYVALITVLIVASVALVISTTVTLLAIGEAQSGLALSKGEDKLQFVEGCMNDALLQFWKNPAYASGTISRPEGNCVITVSTAGQIRTITATGATTNYNRTIQVVASRSGTLKLTSWKEL